MILNATSPGIAIAGDATRSAFSAAALQTLWRAGVRPSVISGCSAGAILAAAAATGQANHLEELWLALAGQQVFAPINLLRGQYPFRMSEIVGGVLKCTLGNRRMGDVNLDLLVVVTLLRAGRLVRRVVTREDAALSLIDVLLASAFLPPAYHRPVRVDGCVAFDGAWMSKVPIQEVLDRGAPFALACMAQPGGRMAGGVFRRSAAPIANERVHVIAPSTTLALGFFDFDASRTHAAFAAGRERAEAALRTMDVGSEVATAPTTAG